MIEIKTPQPLRYLVLLVTTACNARCVYCYRDEEQLREMTPDVAYAALDLALRSGEPFHVQLAGGEPALALGLVEHIGARRRKTGAAATLALQTNGACIDSRLTKLCWRYRIDVGISVGGPPETQEPFLMWIGIGYADSTVISRMEGECADCTLSGRCPGDCPSRLRYNAIQKDAAMCTVYRTIAAEIASSVDSARKLKYLTLDCIT